MKQKHLTSFNRSVMGSLFGASLFVTNIFVATLVIANLCLSVAHANLPAFTSLMPYPTSPFHPVPVNQPQTSSTDVTTKKITDSLTLKINRDLFEKGVHLDTKGYGQYFAHLESSQYLDTKFKETPASTVLQRKLRQSKMNTGVRVGGYLGEKSKLYLKVDCQSENVAPANTLKTKTLNDSNQGAWSSSIASGFGFEYGATKSISVTGEASTAALKNPLRKLSPEETVAPTPSSTKRAKRDNRVLVGLRYHFGDK